VQSPSNSLRAGLKALYAALTVVALDPLKLPTAALPKGLLSPAEFYILPLLGYIGAVTKVDKDFVPQTTGQGIERSGDSASCTLRISYPFKPEELPLLIEVELRQQLQSIRSKRLCKRNLYSINAYHICA
jgi:hypothetical protein